MLKFVAAAAALAVPFALAAPAHADTYVGLGLNQGSAQSGGVQIDPQLGYQVVAGEQFGPLDVNVGYARLNGEVAGIVHANADDFYAEALAGINFGPVRLAGGAGVDYVRGEGTVAGWQVGSVDGSDWHLAAKATLKVNNDWSLAGEYRQLQNNDIRAVSLTLERHF